MLWNVNHFQGFRPSYQRPGAFRAILSICFRGPCITWLTLLRIIKARFLIICSILILGKHSGELPFTCSYCGNRYISAHSLAQHEKAAHLLTEVNYLLLSFYFWYQNCTYSTKIIVFCELTYKCHFQRRFFCQEWSEFLFERLLLLIFLKLLYTKWYNLVIIFIWFQCKYKIRI